jgi:hypothetical protein
VSLSEYFSVGIVLAAVLSLPAYMLLIRPRRIIREFQGKAERDGGEVVPISAASATAPVPIGRVHNSLFPQLAIFGDRIEYHILTSKALMLSDIGMVTLSNGGFGRSIVTLLANNEAGHKIDFVMKPQALERVLDLLESKLSINDERK